MVTFKITDTEWEVLKLKLQRKYNHLTDEDLQYKEGEEDQLIDGLAKRLGRNRDYVIFTLSKQLADLSSNRL
ncbi:MAG TPA: hypothetical protein PKA53_01170 [Sphingobacterium sp.]|nr:hypothetical protein [Sphingobacterium sp.]